MTSIKRTFSLPDSLSTQLDKTIPHKERSKFIAHSLKEALHKYRKQELLELLTTLPKQHNPEGIRSEDVLREIRSQRAEDIIANM